MAYYCCCCCCFGNKVTLDFVEVETKKRFIIPWTAALKNYELPKD